MYVYCTYHTPICCAIGMEKESFARIVGAIDLRFVEHSGSLIESSTDFLNHCSDAVQHEHVVSPKHHETIVWISVFMVHDFINEHF